ncbi:MAG: universal stress protein [Thermodesulfobacteriota bacterium]|nr:universal stress protein [Thermodesulfobacteriota bacterium]
MLELKNILIPVDFSAFSKYALKYGAVLARLFDARILILHVISQEWLDEMKAVQYFGGAIDSPEELLARKKSYVAEMIEKMIKEEIDETSLEDKLIVVGVPADEIIRLAEEREIDLIIVGTHGRSGLSKVFLGSVAQRVARRAPCSVLCVREKRTDK